MAFATIATSTSTGGTSLSAAANLAVPGGAVAGNLLIWFISSDATGGTAITASTGWTAITNTSQVITGNVHAAIAFARILDGGANDTLNPNGAAQDYTAISALITGHGITNVANIQAAGTFSATNGSADPPNLAPGSTQDWVWLAYGAIDKANGADAISANPSSYDPLNNVSSASSTSSSYGRLSSRNLNGSSENPGTFTNTSRPWIAMTVAIPPTPPAPKQGAGNGTVDWVGSATGTNVHSGSASGTVAWVGSSTGTSVHSGAASGTVAWVGSATGEAPVVPPEEGSASGSITWAGSATGTSVHSGSATGSITWAGAAAGAATHTGASPGTVAWSGSATGVTARQGAASGAITWAGTANGEAPGSDVSEGDATGSITWAGAATGATIRRGSATGSVTWAGVASGVAPVPGDDGDSSIPDEDRVLPVNERRTFRVAAENRTMEVPAP